MWWIKYSKVGYLLFITHLFTTENTLLSFRLLHPLLFKWHSLTAERVWVCARVRVCQVSITTFCNAPALSVASGQTGIIPQPLISLHSLYTNPSLIQNSPPLSSSGLSSNILPTPFPVLAGWKKTIASVSLRHYIFTCHSQVLQPHEPRYCYYFVIVIYCGLQGWIWCKISRTPRVVETALCQRDAYIWFFFFFYLGESERKS